MGRAVRGLLAACTVLLTLTAAPAAADSAPDAGVAWAPPPLPDETYAIDGTPQVRFVTASDGTQLYTETYLPDPMPPGGRVPVVVQYTPYASRGGPDDRHLIDLLVPRGYGVTFAHVRGTGGSEGCIEQTAAHEVDDGARIVEDAGALAPWSSGAVGLHGISYPGGTQVATATGPDRERLQYLKAIVVGAPVASAYEFYNRDGVPQILHAVAGAFVYLLQGSNPFDRPELLVGRLGCLPPILVGSVDVSGNYTGFYAERDHTRHLDRLEAATLMVHGSTDRRVLPNQQLGLFDRIPASTPHVGLFGVWDHEWPDDYDFNGPLDPAVSPRRDWERIDWDAIQFAWYERYLRGVHNGADGWPTQVQGTDGQWRTASRWPAVPGPQRSLLLGGGGVLGATAPTGTTTYLETPLPELEAPGLPTDLLPGSTAVFTTAPFTERTEVIGAATLDLWVQLLLPDSHLTARLEVVDVAGARITHESRTVGARSAMHLDPIVDERFRQVAPKPAPVGTSFLVPIRLDPIDLVVPAGARLRLTLAGSSIIFDGLDGVSEGAGAVLQGPSLPSLLVQPVTILHDAAHPSALRFTLPEVDSQLLDVQEADQLDFGAVAPAPPVAAVPEAPTPAGGSSLPATGGTMGLLLPSALAAVAALLLRRPLHGR